MLRFYAGIPIFFLFFCLEGIAQNISPTCQTIDRTTLIACALRAHPEIQLQAAMKDSADAALLSTRSILPSNPVMGFSIARRKASGIPSEINWYANLNQEVELAGQRAKRREAFKLDILAEEQRTIATIRQVAATAWKEYFEVIAAMQSVALAKQLTIAAETVARAAQASAEKGLIAQIQADVALTEWARLAQMKGIFERGLNRARSELFIALGLQEEITIEGSLNPLDEIENYHNSTINAHPKLEALKYDAQAATANIEKLKRERIPNPTFGAYVQRDGFAENVLGGGLSLSIPLPEPIGTFKTGAIAAAAAQSRILEAQHEFTRRTLLVEKIASEDAYLSYKKELEIFSEERLQRTQLQLANLSSELAAGKMSFAEGAPLQRSLIEFLLANIELRKNLCLASVAFAEALGLPLERGYP